MRYDFPIVLPIAVDRFREHLSVFVGRVRARWMAILWGIKMGRGCRFQGTTYFRTRRIGEIVLGDHVVLNSDFSSNLVGIINPTVMDTRGGGRIQIGDYSGLTSAVIHSRSSITIGSHVKIGANVRILDHDFHSVEAEYRITSADRDHIRTKPVCIGDACFIGTNAMILKGTNLGARSIVAAGSVVFGLKVPPDSLVKGNPAEIVRIK